ncbi:glycosyltransferase [Aliivibrio fischeri]|uniref:glycosyltransferase n=1 Tax=Aliivibrio fischeri TaxID=668 RepID=UPI0007C479BD|nr:glycosyltransferase [Aliivibrio fischeri]
MISFFNKYIKDVSNLDVYIVYVGSFNLNIGPPSSMVSLFKLLRDSFNCRISSNLTQDKVDAYKLRPKKNIVTLNRKNPIPLIINLLEVVKEFKLFLSILSFNFKCNMAYLVNKDVKIIITQPWLIPVSSKMNVIYTRRANVSRHAMIGDGIVRKFFEYFFNRSTFIKVVYLVEQTSCEPNTYIIPNFFDERNFDPIVPSTEKIRFNFAGTWNYRKGANEIAILASKFDINVYGALTDDSECNKLLETKGIKYLGSVPRCYDNYFLGDIFLSFSKVEGFQRSVAESLLKGCLIIARERPDSLSIRDFPGVYIIKYDDNLDSVMEEVLNELNNMSFEERMRIGMENRALAIKMFSETKVFGLWKDLLTC